MNENDGSRREGEERYDATGISSIRNFEDMKLKPDLLQAIEEYGFEYPSQVQRECIPIAMNAEDVICEAKPGAGKTAIYILSTPNQIEVSDDHQVRILVLVP